MRLFSLFLPICRLRRSNTRLPANHLFLNGIRHIQEEELPCPMPNFPLQFLCYKTHFFAVACGGGRPPCRHLVRPELEVFSSRSRQSASKKNSPARLKTARKGPSVFAARHRIRRTARDEAKTLRASCCVLQKNALRPMGKASVEPIRATAFPIRNLGACQNG